MIRKNLFWKLFALGVALVLWGHVNAERNPQSRKTFTVPLEAHNLAKGYVAEFVDTREIVVAVHGPESTVDGIRKEDVSVWVNLSGQSAGDGSSEESKKVYARVSDVPQNELDVTTSPARARVRTEAIRWKRIPVEVKFLSPPPLGFSYSAPVMEPAIVAISGRTSAVSKVRKVVIGLSGEHRSRVIDEDFKALAVDDKGNVVSDVDLDEDTVHLKLRFVEAPATKVVIVSPSIVGQPKFPAVVSRVTVTPPTVPLEGGPAVLMNLSTVSTDPVEIDQTQIEVTKQVALRVPDGIRLLGRRNVRVTVYVTSPKPDVVKPH